MTARPRSNSFHFTLREIVGPLPRAHFGACPVRHAGPARWTRGRTLFLRRDGVVAAYATDTSDFDDEALADVEHGTGQLYLDLSSKPAPDDFARDLRKLERSAVCAGCPAFDACAGLFDPAIEDVFTRDDAVVRGWVASLRGAVLDVGCGHGPYGDAFAALAATGAITYAGIDPDARHVTSLRTRWAWAHLRAIPVESIDASERYDHVLVLRSWNHFSDAARAAAALFAVLRPGGALFVADNTAFGLVRSRARAAAAEQGPAVFEHFRNDGAAEAEAVLSEAGFVVEAHAAVTPATSNQWWIRARRPT